MTKTELQIRVSYNYHKKRERFFRLMDAGSKFLSIAALTALVSLDSYFGIGIAIISAAATILSIVLDFSGMASKHESLAVSFLALLRKLTAKEVSDQEAGALCKDIGAREPTVLRGLAQLCQDEQEAANGEPVTMNRLSIWRRIRAQFGFGEMPIDWA